MGWANLRKREKTNGLVGAKNRGRGGPTYGKEKKNGLVGAKNRGLGGSNLMKKRKRKD